MSVFTQISVKIEFILIGVFLAAADESFAKLNLVRIPNYLLSLI